MGLQYKVLAALVEDSGLVGSANSGSQLGLTTVPRDQCPLLVSAGTAHMWCTNVHGMYNAQTLIPINTS